MKRSQCYDCSEPLGPDAMPIHGFDKVCPSCWSERKEALDEDEKDYQ